MNKVRHNYEYDVDTSSQTAPANVVRLVGQGKKVLEVGCGPGSITRILAEQGQCRVTALELDKEAIEIVKPFCEVVIQADLNTEDWPELIDDAEKFDVVVAADVLEHLYDPWSTLKRMTDFISSHGYLVISLPHIGHAAVMACLMDGNFDYRDWGLLDRTHIRFFCLKNIEALFAQAGLKIIEVKYVMTPPEETEFGDAWSKLSPQVQTALMTSPYADVYQVVVKAVPLYRPGNGVPLEPPKLMGTTVIKSRGWKTRIGTHLSPQLKHKIRKGFGMLGIKI